MQRQLDVTAQGMGGNNVFAQLRTVYVDVYNLCAGGKFETIPLVISGAQKELLELAEAIDAPIGCSLMGVSALSTSTGPGRPDFASWNASRMVSARSSTAPTK